MRVEERTVRTTYDLKEIAVLKRQTQHLTHSARARYLTSADSYWRFVKLPTVTVERFRLERGYPWDNDVFARHNDDRRYAEERRLQLSLRWKDDILLHADEDNDKKDKVDENEAVQLDANTGADTSVIVDVAPVTIPFRIDLEEFDKCQRLRRGKRKQDPTTIEFHSTVAELIYRRKGTSHEIFMENVRLFFMDQVDLQDFLQLTELHARIVPVTRLLHFSDEPTKKAGGESSINMPIELDDSSDWTMEEEALGYESSTSTVNDTPFSQSSSLAPPAHSTRARTKARTIILSP